MHPFFISTHTHFVLFLDLSFNFLFWFILVLISRIPSSTYIVASRLSLQSLFYSFSVASISLLYLFTLLSLFIVIFLSYSCFGVSLLFPFRFTLHLQFGQAIGFYIPHLFVLYTYAYARVSYWILHFYRTIQQLRLCLLVGSSLLHSDQRVTFNTRTSKWYHITTYVWIDFSTRHYWMLILLCEWSEPQYFSRMQDHYIKIKFYHPFELSRVFFFVYIVFSCMILREIICFSPHFLDITVFVITFVLF